MFLVPDGSGTVETYGRIATVKKYVYEQSRSVASHGHGQASDLRLGLDECREELQGLREGMAKLAAAVSRLSGEPGVPAVLPRADRRASAASRRSVPRAA